MVNGKITNSGFTQELLKYFYSPNLIFKNTNLEFQNLYCFLSRIQPWDNESITPPINVTDNYLKEIYKNIVAIKRINTNDISPVIERIDWQANTIYSQYSSNTDMFLLGNDNKLEKKFYVRNSYDQIFKCLYNNSSVNNVTGGVSTIQPVIDFSYDSSVGFIETADGYKWKYLYSIDAGSKLKFFDDNWIPVTVISHRKDISSSSVGLGEISVINVYNSGNNYIDDTGLGISSTVTITGDGTGASAFAVISSNSVSKILVANTGTNYSTATVTITPNQGYTGNGAILIPEISPIGGHGFDLLSELGCRTVMITSTFDSTENGNLPGDIDYRQIGLLSNPVVKFGSSTQYANSYIYRLTQDVKVSSGAGVFNQDEFVFQGISLESSTFSGRVLNFDPNNNIIYLINTSGSIKLNDLIKGSDSKTLRVVSDSSVEQIVPYSGTISYVENRTKIQRSINGLEQFRLTINY